MIDTKEKLMQIRKTYSGVNPELVYDEVKDFIIKQDLIMTERKMETSALPGDSSSFLSRGTMTFATKNGKNAVCIRAHIVGSIKTETRMILDIDEKLFPPEKISSLQQDIDFIFSSYEVK